MRVKIIKAGRKSYWYAKHIGKVFKIERISYDGGYTLVNGPCDYETWIKYHVQPDDGVVVYGDSFIDEYNIKHFKFV